MRLEIYDHLYQKRVESKAIFQCKQIKCDYFIELEPYLEVFQIWHEFSSCFAKIVKLNEFKDFLPMHLACRMKCISRCCCWALCFWKALQLSFDVEEVEINVVMSRKSLWPFLKCSFFAIFCFYSLFLLLQTGHPEGIIVFLFSIINIFNYFWDNI